MMKGFGIGLSIGLLLGLIIGLQLSLYQLGMTDNASIVYRINKLTGKTFVSRNYSSRPSSWVEIEE